MSFRIYLDAVLSRDGNFETRRAFMSAWIQSVALVVLGRNYLGNGQLTDPPGAFIEGTLRETFSGA